MAIGALRVSVVLKAASGTSPPFGNAVVDAMACDPAALLDPVEFRLFCEAVAELVGPLLTGLSKPVHVLQRGSEVNDIVHLAAVAVVDAQEVGKPYESMSKAAV